MLKVVVIVNRNGSAQRVLNKRALLSRRRMIWLLLHPLLLLSLQQFASLSQSSCVSPVELTDGMGVGEEPNHTAARKTAIL